MSLHDDLLIPIPGPNPAGENLRYAPVYDKIKEARREEDDAPQGEWRRERKLADWPLTIKLITEALSKKTKDLQLAAWLTEALTRRNGMTGLQEGLQVLHGLVETFWDSLYPEIEDGDVEFRAAPLQWVGEKLENAVKSTPLTRSGYDFYRYKESRAVGYEEQAAESDSKTAARAEAIAEGKITAEQFDEAFAATPKAWYAQLVATCDSVSETIAALSELCDSKFGDDAPSFTRLKSTVEEVRQSAHILLAKKRETEPDPVEEVPAAQLEPQGPEPAAAPVPAVAPAAAAAAAAPAPARAPRTIAGEPAGYDDAVERLVVSAAFLRRQQPSNPAPYLMLRGFRWGELRAGGKTIDPTLLDPPSSEVRQQLKRLSLQSDWDDLLEAAENAMGRSYGRGWLDIQRYTCRACAELGKAFATIGEAVKSELRTLLHDLPGLPQMTLMDDTATASPDTLAWLAEVGALPLTAGSSRAAAPPNPEATSDAFELASQAVAEGRPQEGLEILSRELARERSGRGRFNRKVQMAQLCLSIGRDAIAFPLLNDLAAEIETRKLEEWESPDAVAHPLALLYRCLDKMEAGSDEKQKLYERICRLDPAQAMSVGGMGDGG
jgi:type VI secretion system protein ImpA